MKVLLCLVALLAFAYAATVPYKNCGASSDHVKISNLDVKPWPPVKGKPVTITASGAIDEAMTGGSYTMSITYLGITLYSKSGDVCTFSPSLKCPVKKGPATITKTLSLPSIAPAGTYTVKLSAKDSTGAELLCASVDAQLSVVESEALAVRPTAAITQDIIDKVNSAKTTWKAGFNKRFEGHTLAHVASLCGALDGKRLPEKAKFVLPNMPATFDSRTQWPMCKSIQAIRDQGACGSCWAFGAAEAMTDRVCISSNGKLTPWLAAEDLVSCCGFSCGMGCDGGYPGAAWDYFQNTGIVTGGPWDSKQGCYPYQIASCDHHVNGTKPACGSLQPTPACNQVCQNGAEWESDKHFGSTSYSVSSDVNAIMTEIMTNGPVEAAYTVYADFPAYKSGVYKHVTGQALGGHAVKILGWGSENGTPYWLVANSWNTDWGNKGFFKILRGADECGIESGIVAGLPSV